MKFLLSGEGPTDIGCWRIDCSGKAFLPGPMTIFIDNIAKERDSLGHSFLDGSDAVQFVSEKDLTSKKGSKPKKFPGKKSGKNTGFFTKNAQILGLLALEKSNHEQCTVVAVLFRDSDGTRTREEWNKKWDSIIDGFARVGYDFGVPMVPRKKSEAWLLAALDNNGNPCLDLENRSGNDNSPNSLKRELQDRLHGNVNRELLIDLLNDGVLDQSRIQLPSFLKFKKTLQDVILLAQQSNSEI